MRSLRNRLWVLLAGGTGAVLLVAWLVLEIVAVSWVEREFDRALLAKARALVTLTKQDGRRVELDFADEFMPEFEARRRPEYFQVDLDDGRTLERSRSLVRAGARLPRRDPPGAEPRFSDLVLPDGRAGRLVEIVFVPQIEAEGIADLERAIDPASLGPGSPWVAANLRVAGGRDELDGRVRRLRGGLALGGLVVLAVQAVLIGAALGLGLRPLDAIRRQVERLRPETLGTPVQVADPPAEIAPVVEQLNALLARLAEAFERERRLSSDLAHELRTPIAELRLLTEVGEREVGDARAAEWFADARAIAARMEEVVAQLLMLARCEAGAEPVACVEVALAELVDRAWRGLTRQAAAREVVLDNRVPRDLRWRSDPEKLGLVLANLLANAVDYGPAGDTVVVAAEAQRPKPPDRKPRPGSLAGGSAAALRALLAQGPGALGRRPRRPRTGAGAGARRAPRSRPRRPARGGFAAGDHAGAARHLSFDARLRSRR